MDMQQDNTTILSDPRLTSNCQQQQFISSPSTGDHPKSNRLQPISIILLLSATNTQVDRQDFSLQQHCSHSTQPKEIHTVTGRDTNKTFLTGCKHLAY